MAFQGLASFPGVVQVVSCRYTRGLGTLPGHAVLEYRPQAGSIAAAGALQFAFPPSGNLITLPGCRVDFGSIRQSAHSGASIFVRIWDRRWAWHAGGEISGRYNVTRSDGTLDTSTEKTPQQLATLLLQAMGEQSFNVSSLPNAPRPYRDWEYAHPATELDRLCEEFGCRVALRMGTNSVIIVRLGQGAPLPNTDIHTLSFAANLAEAPDALKVVCGWTRFQSKLKLQAVGLDNDGRIRPIDELSYKPSAGWSGVVDPNFSLIADKQDQALARKTVWKWYQAYAQADGTQQVPGYQNVQKIERLFPLFDRLVETRTTPDGEEVPQAAFIDGEWWDAETLVESNTSLGTKYHGDFVLDGRNGVVQFPEQIYKLDGASRVQAEIYLTCSYYVEDPQEHFRLRYTGERDLAGNNGTGAKIIHRDDIRATAYATYLRGINQVESVTTNEQQVLQLIGDQLDASQLEYGATQAWNVGYNGIKLIDIDGRTRQVTFNVDSREAAGERGGAETHASVNSETDHYVPRYRARRALHEGQARRGIDPLAYKALREQGVL